MTHTVEAPGTIDHSVDTHEAGNIHRIRINRPAKLNALHSALGAALRDAIDASARDDDARVVILEGAGGRAWIGGADIREMATLDAKRAREFISGIHAVCHALRHHPAPVIAAIQGHCLGAGLEVAACCDLRVATDGSRFAMPEVAVGLPSVVEAAVLPRLIGIGHARDLVLTARVIDAATALRWGLVDTVVADDELDAAVLERIAPILAAGPRAVRAQKTLCRQWEELPLTEAIAAGIDAFEETWRDDEPRRYLEKFLSNR